MFMFVHSLLTLCIWRSSEPVSFADKKKSAVHDRDTLVHSRVNKDNIVAFFGIEFKTGASFVKQLPNL